MSSNVNVNGSYLPNSRKFPLKEADQQQELGKAWIDIARSVNERTIGIYSTVQSLTGNQWSGLEINSPTNLVQNPSNSLKTFRQVYLFNDATLTFNHNIPSLFLFTQMYGIGSDNTIYFNIPYVDTSSAANQISLLCNQTQVIVTKGAGTPPSIARGYIVLEWIN
jgi:hypothetical protein